MGKQQTFLFRQHTIARWHPSLDASTPRPCSPASSADSATSTNTALLKVEGCAGNDDAKWYIGKRCAYVYRAKNKTSVPNKSQKSNFREIRGKETRTHGNAGSVRAKFA